MAHLSIDDINAKHGFKPTGTKTRPSASNEDLSAALTKIRVIATSNGLDLTDPKIDAYISHLAKLHGNDIAENAWLKDIVQMPQYAGRTKNIPVHDDMLFSAESGIKNAAVGLQVDIAQYPEFVSELATIMAKLRSENLAMGGVLHPGVQESAEISRMKKLAGIQTPVVENTKANDIDLFESLKLIHDTKNNILAVVSDNTDPKAASNETFTNKKLLGANGFKWDAGNKRWWISAEQFDHAKDIISKANKTEYLISKLEELEQMVSDAAPSDKNELLKDKITGYVNKLASETDEKAASDEIRRYMSFFARFHQYSFYNRILIYIQRPDATKVASFNKWKEKNRVVNKGAKGILVFVPIFDKGKNPLLNPDAELTNPKGFTVGNVFDISDTSAINPEGEIPDEPKWWGDETPSETADNLFDYVRQAAVGEGLNITRDSSMRGEKGYSAGGHINISSDVEGAAKVATLIHEYAHELMHHKESSKYYIGDENIRNKPLKELQAESVSYVVLTHYNIPASHNTTYLALWKASGQSIQENLRIISTVAEHIIRKIDRAAGKAEEREAGFTESIISDMSSFISESMRMIEMSGI